MVLRPNLRMLKEHWVNERLSSPPLTSKLEIEQVVDIKLENARLRCLLVLR